MPASKDNMDDEILVHISAPATRQHDELCQALADAYLDFEPYQPGYLRQPGQKDEQQDATINEQIPNLEPSSKNAIQLAASSSMVNTSKVSYGSFPSHLSSGVHSHQHEVSTVYGSFESIEDAVCSASRPGQLEQIQSNWRKHRVSLPGFAMGNCRRTRSSNSSESKPIIIEDSQLAARATESQVWDHYSTTSEDTSEEITDRISSSKSPTPQGVKLRHGSDHCWGTLEPLPFPQQPITVIRADADVDESAETGFIQNSGQMRFSTRTNRSQRSLRHIETSEVPDFSMLPFEVYPPAPTISMDCPGTLPSQVTEYLQGVKSQNPHRFRPFRLLRTLDIDERGYWLVDCEDWPPKLQYEFWSSLCAHVSNGSFGWGVTLHRNLQTTHELGQIRFYCWGEVAEHVWLSLWQCSSGKMSDSVAKWLDAEDKVVIEAS